MFKENRLIFEKPGEAPARAVEAQKAPETLDPREYDAEFQAAKAKRIAERMPIEIQKILEGSDATSLKTTKLRRIRNFLSGYVETRQNLAYAGSKDKKREIQTTLSQIAQLAARVDIQISNLENPPKQIAKPKILKPTTAPTQTPTPAPIEAKNNVSNSSPENYTEALAKLNWRNIGSLDKSQIKNYFAVIKQKYDEALTKNPYDAQNILRQLKDSIFPQNEYAAGMFYSDSYANGEFKSYIKSIQNKQSPYGRSYTAINNYLKTAKQNNGLHNMVFAEYAQTFGRIDWGKTSYMFASSNIGAIPAENTLTQNHIGALDVFFNPVKMDGKREIGPDVRAVASGIVIASGDNWAGGASETTYQGGGLSPKGGNVVITFNPLTSEYHYYSHMANGINVRIGDFVEAGTFIGKGGNTGGAIADGHGRHVHFEVHKYNAQNNYNTPQNAFELRARLVRSKTTSA
jgi:murein DD-endopeptidase MepM/ murein hydrolase activator NlpD